MDKISNLLGSGGKYKRLAKPLTAARVCEASRAVAKGRFETLSFHDGLLTICVKNSGEAANLQMESDKLKEEINQKLDEATVEKIRIKTV